MASIFGTRMDAFAGKGSDSLVKNLREEYPQLEGIHGSTRLGTLKERFGVDSLSQVLKRLEEKR